MTALRYFALALTALFPMKATADQAADAARVSDLASVEEVTLNLSLNFPVVPGSVETREVSVDGCVLTSETVTRTPGQDLLSGMRITVDLTGGGVRHDANGRAFRYTPPQGDDPLGYGAVWVMSQTPAIAEGISRPKNDPAYAASEVTTPNGTLMTDLILGLFSIQDEARLVALSNALQGYIDSHCAGSS